MSHKDFIVANLAYRIGQYHPGHQIHIGSGNTNASVLVIQPHTKMPERDAITGALKNFGMLDDAYRATIQLVEFDRDIEYPDLARRTQRGEPLMTGPEINRAYLRELIDIIRPMLIVACGEEVVSFLRQKNIRSFRSYAGKKFLVEDLTNYTVCATLNPADYGFARAPVALKEQGKREWTQIAKLFHALKEKSEKERWAC